MMKGHTGYKGCFYCLINGERHGNRMVFPQSTRANWPKRKEEHLTNFSEKVTFSLEIEVIFNDFNTL